MTVEVETLHRVPDVVYLWKGSFMRLKVGGWAGGGGEDPYTTLSMITWRDFTDSYEMGGNGGLPNVH